MLVLSSVTPTPGDNLDLLAGFLPLPVVEGAHFLASILGLMLVVIARGLAQRLDGAWWGALIVALLALALSLAKAVAVYEAALLAILVLALLPSRRLFQRKASLGPALTSSWLLAVAVLIGALPSSLSYDGSDDLLNPTRGFRLAARVSPSAATSATRSPTRSVMA